MSTVLKKQTQNPTKALAAMDDLVRTGSTSFFFRCYVTDSDLSFLSLLYYQIVWKKKEKNGVESN